MTTPLLDVVGGYDAEQQAAFRDAIGRDKVAEWAVSFRGLQQMFPVMVSPPVVTIGTTNTSTTNASAGTNGITSANVVTAANLVQLDGSRFDDKDGSTAHYYFPAHITNSLGTKDGGNCPYRCRFMTDADELDLCFLAMEQTYLGINVDGETVTRKENLTPFTNIGNYRYVNVQFGTDVLSYSKGNVFPITAGGSGYALGDQITLDVSSTGGETITSPIIVRVIQVNAGAVEKVALIDSGNLTTLPSGYHAQTSTTGTGSGFQLTAQFYAVQHSVKRMRLVELIIHGPGQFNGVVKKADAIILPWGYCEHLPKFAFVGDSITAGTYLKYGGAHWPCQSLQRLGLWDARWTVSAKGGTGFVTPSGTSIPWSDDARIADFIADDADVYVFAGSQNDAPGAPLTAAVTKVVDAIHAAKPNAYIVGIGNIMGQSTTIRDSLAAGYAAAASQSRLRFIDNQNPSWFPSLYGQWNVSSDSGHPGPEGLDYFAANAAANIYAAIQDMTANG